MFSVPHQIKLGSSQPHIIFISQKVALLGLQINLLFKLFVDQLFNRGCLLMDGCDALPQLLTIPITSEHESKKENH